VSESPESVVRKFHASWLRSDLDEVVGFFSDDAVYTDGPREVYRGIDAIRAGLDEMLRLVPSTKADIKTLVANAGTVMVERVDNFDIAGKPFAMEIAAAFEVDNDGRITRWRDYYDLRSIEDRIAAG
jgi:limonene-1,2-epoxide hydrolase